MSGHFTQTVVCDFEYEIADGDLPNVLCMVCYVLDVNLQHVRTIKLWRGEFGATPFDIRSTLFVAYTAWAELTCFKVLNWKFPTHVFDCHTAYLAASNILLPYNPDETRKRERKRLPDACRAYGIEGWELIDKEEISKAIGEGRWDEYGKDAVLTYCEEDVKKTYQLLIAQLRGNNRFPRTSVEHVLHWSNYSAKAVSLIQARGMPIDMYLWNLVEENKQAIVAALVRKFDPSQGTDHPIYTLEGEWSYERFEYWLSNIGVIAWPRLDSGRPDIDSDAFRMYHIPGIEGLHALRDALGVVTKAKLPIGRDGRNRPSLFPFATASGRNAHAKSLYNAHASMRSFMVFPPDKIGVYLDFRSQEVGVAAALSDDEALMADYREGDVYYGLAKLCGQTYGLDLKQWKKSKPDVRQRMKPLQLGINYGMGVPSLAKGLDRHPLIASTIIELHKRKYARFWEWRENAAMRAMLDRRIESVFGWPLHISNSPNKRTLYNFPMQSNGAEMLRLAAVRLCDAGLIPNMLVHDGILLELNNKEEIAAAIEIMKAAGRDVCGGFEIGVDIDQLLERGARYQDKRPMAKKMWDVVMQTLAEVGALPKDHGLRRQAR